MQAARQRMSGPAHLKGQCGADKHKELRRECRCYMTSKIFFDEVEKEYKLWSQIDLDERLATLLITCMALSRELYLTEPLLSL